MDNSAVRAARKRAESTRKIIQNFSDTDKLKLKVTALEIRMKELEDMIKDNK